MANLKIKEIPKNTEVNRILHDEMTDEFQEHLVLFGEDDTCLPIHYKKFSESIDNFEVRNSDVWVCSFPKTGTTWTQEMVWLIANGVDFEGAKTKLRERFPFLEVCTLTNMEAEKRIVGGERPEYISNSVQYAKRKQDPRFIKTHLPFSFLPREICTASKQPKIIYVVRNPKDTCVSYYHHCRLFQGCRANLEDFAEVFMAGKAVYGSFWKHLFSYWKQRHLPNLLIIKYEDMKNDLPSVIRKVARFLDKIITDAQIEQLTKHLSFESMKNNQAVNAEDSLSFRKEKNLTIGDGAFLREGRVGQYKEELSDETVKKFDAWIKENLDGTDFADEYNYNL